MSAVFTIKYGDIMILHSFESYVTLPEVHLVETIYTDPMNSCSCGLQDVQGRNSRREFYSALHDQLQGDLEDKFGAKVLVGSMDSERLPGFMEKNWPPKK